MVVDSGSTDDTLTIARSHRAEIVHYPSDENFNYSRAINVGMKRVDTKYTLIISSHVSLPDPETLRFLTDLLQDDGRRCAASICGMVESADDAEKGELQWETVTADNFVTRYGGIGISNSCNLIPTELWHQHPFDEDIPRCEDQKWLQYFLDRGRTAARVMRPQIVYNNPYYNDTKEIQDLVTLAKYDINSTLTNTESLAQRLRGATRALRHLDLSEFLYETRLVYELLLVRLGLHEDSPSRYF
ncbi:glycosyltransferase involved in cell wall biosynthesis [Salinibacter ruber]|nr:glycosyltransferase involved in cell wall biosynthesis [Salinibacter ruber]